MRLIDADKLIDYFYYGEDDKPIIDGISDRKIINIIKNQPTAFDTEKVVEQLEERKEEVSGCFEVMCSDCKYTEECHEGEKDYKVAFDSAIDIVKKGGVE